MSRKTRICLILVAVFSIAGIFTALHLVQIHYKKPQHTMNLLNRLPIMEKFIDKKKIEGKLMKEEMSKLKKDDPFKNPEFDPYAQAEEAFGNVMTKEEAEKEAKGGDEVCDYSAKVSCTKVDESKYSEISGIAVSLYGLFGNIVMLLLAGLCLARNKPVETGRKDIPALLLFMSCMSGLLFCLWLTYLESFVIKAYCPFCLASAMFVLLSCVALLAGYGISPIKNIFSKNNKGEQK